jgi:D-alanyl-D-alanine carboxypeptidase
LVVACSSVAALLTFASSPTQAAPYSDIVVDANSGKVLHETNPDARRHPASLTKIMTLYLLFEQLEAGKLKLDSQLKVSREAAGQMPTKLGLKPGSTLQVEDAIKGIVTRSANDAAVVVAEALAADEDGFAKLMTRKAQSLGMTHTVYKNASGLPNDSQVTTARDQGGNLDAPFREDSRGGYKYFSIRSFTFRGQSIGTTIISQVGQRGVDGIRLGLFGPPASIWSLGSPGNRYVVAVVMGRQQCRQPRCTNAGADQRENRTGIYEADCAHDCGSSRGDHHCWQRAQRSSQGGRESRRARCAGRSQG